jgi:hypothetical protein
MKERGKERKREREKERKREREKERKREKPPYVRKFIRHLIILSLSHLSL